MAYSKNRKPIVSEILIQCPWFSSLPESLRKGLLDHSSIVKLEHHQALRSPGATEARLYCVVAGALGVSSCLENGKELLVTLMEPVSWGSELSFFDGAPRTHAAYAIKPSLVLLISWL